MPCLRLELTPVPASRPRVTRWATYYAPAYTRYMEDAARALAPHVPAEPISGPVVCRFGFQSPRPPSHYRTGRNAHLLKSSAPELPVSARSGDLDNYAKSILDALVSARILADDGQALELVCAKRYGATGLTVVQIEKADLEADLFRCFDDAGLLTEEPVQESSSPT